MEIVFGKVLRNEQESYQIGEPEQEDMPSKQNEYTHTSVINVKTSLCGSTDL